MKWIIDLKEKDDVAVQRAVKFCKEFLSKFNTTKLEWIRIDNGRKDFTSFYGRCWYPKRGNRRFGYRVSCQINSSIIFPFIKEQRRKPIYVTDWTELSNITLPDNHRMGAHKESADGSKKWVRIYEDVRYNSFDECVVAIFGHEIGHFLSKTKQIPVKNMEIDIDRFQDAFVSTYKKIQNESISIH